MRIRSYPDDPRLKMSIPSSGTPRFGLRNPTTIALSRKPYLRTAPSQNPVREEAIELYQPGKDDHRSCKIERSIIAKSDYVSQLPIRCRPTFLKTTQRERRKVGPSIEKRPARLGAAAEIDKKNDLDTRKYKLQKNAIIYFLGA